MGDHNSGIRRPSLKLALRRGEQVGKESHSAHSPHSILTFVHFPSKNLLERRGETWTIKEGSSLLLHSNNSIHIQIPYTIHNSFNKSPTEPRRRLKIWPTSHEQANKIWSLATELLTRKALRLPPMPTQSPKPTNLSQINRIIQKDGFYPRNKTTLKSSFLKHKIQLSTCNV